MKKIAYIFSIFWACIVMTGCSTYAIPRYSISADNLAELRKIKSAPVALGSFKTVGADDSDAIMCRAAGPVKTPDGETFADYIKKALASELTLAEKYDPLSKVVITGSLTVIQFSSEVGEWNMAMSLMSSNGQQLGVAEKFTYGFSWMADVACIQTAQATLAAVQNLIHKAVSDAAFQALMRPLPDPVISDRLH
jgi:hypothetical protein